MIKIIYSRYPKENSKKIYEYIKNDLTNHKKSFLLVPQQYTLQSDVDMIEALEVEAVMDAKVLSFHSFSRYVMDRVGGSAEDALTPNAKLILISNILNDLNEELTTFKDAYQDIEFSNNLADMISQIKDKGLDEAAFKMIENLDDSSYDRIKNKFHDIKLVYDEYEERIKNKYLDTEDRIMTVIEKLDQADFLKGTSFYFDKFDTLTDLQIELLKALDRMGIDITISLTLEPAYVYDRAKNDLNMFDKSYAFLDRMLRLRDENIKVEAKSIEDKIDNDISYEIVHLVDNFERFEVSLLDADYLNSLDSYVKKIENQNEYFYDYDHIKLFENPSTAKEVENVALFIKKAIITDEDKKVRYKDFAVYITDKDEYENEIVKVFNRNDIPYFIDDTQTLSDNHIIKTFMAALRMVIYNFRIDDISYFINSNLYYFKDIENIREITLIPYLIERNIKGDMFTNDKYFTFDEAYYENLYGVDDKRYKSKEAEITSINNLRLAVLDLLDEVLAIRKGEHEARDIASAIYRLISKDEFRRGIARFQEFLDEDKKNEAKLINQQAVEKFVVILEQFVAIMADRKISLKEAYKLIEAGTKNSKIGVIPPTKDHVIISDLMRSSIANRKDNFIIGLNDAFFPSLDSAANILTNTEIDQLKLISSDGTDKESAIDLRFFEENIEDKQLRDLYKIFTVSENIYLSFAKSNKDNEGLEKAAVLKQINNIFRNIGPIDTSTYDIGEIKFSKDSSIKHMLDLLYAYKNKDKDLTDEDLDFILSVDKYLREDHEDRHKLKVLTDYDLINIGIHYSNDKKRLDTNLSKNLFKKNTWGSSQIDSFSRCPYKHYIDYGIRPVEVRDYEVDPREEGNVVHNVFEELTTHIKGKEPGELESELDRDLYEEILAKHLDNVRLTDPRNQITTENIYDKSKSNYKHIIDQINAGKFMVKDAELKFDVTDDSNLPAVDIDGENVLVGRIDRLDEYVADDGNYYYRVVDYKTGAKDFSLAYVLNKLDFQLIVYILAITDDQNRKPLGAFYLPLKEEYESVSGMYDEDDLKKANANKHKMVGIVTDYITDYENTKKSNIDKARKPMFDIYSLGAGGVSNLESIKIDKKDILTPAQAEMLTQFVKEESKNFVEEIKAGKIDLEPVKESKTRTNCDFCPYGGVCKIDVLIDSDRYREIDKDLTIEDLEKILEKGDRADE